MLPVGYASGMETPEMRIVREMYETSNRGEFERARQYFHPDVVLIVPDTLPDPGAYVGRDALFGYFADWYVTLFESWQVEELGTTQFGSAVVSEHRLRGKGRTSGVEVTMNSASVNVVRDGAIVKVRPQASLEDAAVLLLLKLRSGGRLTGPPSTRPGQALGIGPATEMTSALARTAPCSDWARAQLRHLADACDGLRPQTTRLPTSQCGWSTAPSHL